jgi:hypothetical protein
VPEGLEFILNKALEKDPANRIQNAGELKQALSLCRVVGTTANVSSPPLPVAAPPELIGEKTQVMRRAPAAPLNDVEKTRVMMRAAPAPVPVTMAAPVAVRPQSPPKPAPAQPQYRYCPSCTSPNPVTAMDCQRCGNPLMGTVRVAAAPQAKQWGLYIAIAMVVVLAIALIVVLVGKK